MVKLLGESLLAHLVHTVFIYALSLDLMQVPKSSL